MVEETKKFIRIDLNQFKLHLYLKPEVELTLHFDSPSRKFYLSVIGLVVHEMKKRGRITSISLQDHIHVLALLNKTVGASAGSSKREHLLPRIYRKWKNALPDLESAPLFKVVGRKKRYDDSSAKVYEFSEGVKDSWANLFEYKGSHENVRLRFSTDRFDASLDDVIIVYGENPELKNQDAWEGFVSHLKEMLEGKSKPAHANGELKESVLPTFNQKRWLTALPSKWQWLSLFALIGLIVGVVVLVFWKSNLFTPQVEIASVEKMAFPLPEKPSIVVLPFRNLSDDPKQDYFSDGLTEEIITGLSKLSSIFVIARESTFAYKGKDVNARQVSEELGVRHVLSGSLRKDGDRVRITVQLIDAMTGRHLWAERYNGELKDIFALQDEITKKIITALQVKLTEGEQARFYAKGTNNLEAYLKVMEANRLYFHLTKDGILKAQQLAKEAIALDPNYAFAYKILGSTHAQAMFRGISKNPRESFKRAIGLFRKAIELDDSLAIAHASLGLWSIFARQYDTAMAEGKRALELEPNSADVIFYYAYILSLTGRPEEAIPFFEEAMRLNPKPPRSYLNGYGVTLRDSGQYEEAIVQAKRVIEQEPTDTTAYCVLTSSYSLAGRDEEARATAKELLRIDPKMSVAEFQKFSPHKDRAAVKRYCDALRKAGLPE